MSAPPGELTDPTRGAPPNAASVSLDALAAAGWTTRKLGRVEDYVVFEAGPRGARLARIPTG